MEQGFALLLRNSGLGTGQMHEQKAKHRRGNR
jgi:hypothetical protein